ncbi:LPXTG cell wall anchor domain-containing protein [Macrococcoides canis]|uniref:LPXTG cell wall anchor domain-containing protein n=1 Tax=Macrococcoides canis TaxID=1855823 RepID=UPI001AEC0FDF|nr:LPXTG cell wall anchor domain-containing protein [Macrococcus canis]QTQ07585.1 LPXTG cell wall anchor domain-containing protein [Macrococcus canis]
MNLKSCNKKIALALMSTPLLFGSYSTLNLDNEAHTVYAATQNFPSTIKNMEITRSTEGILTTYQITGQADTSQWDIPYDIDSVFIYRPDGTVVDTLLVNEDGSFKDTSQTLYDTFDYLTVEYRDVKANYYFEAPTTEAPTTEAPTTEAPTTEAPTTEAPTTEAPTTEAPTTEAPTTEAPTTEAPTTEAPTTEAPTTEAPTTEAPTTEAPTTEAPTTEALTTEAPTTEAPTTEAPTTEAPTTEAPTTEAPTTEAPTTEAPSTELVLNNVDNNTNKKTANSLNLNNEASPKTSLPNTGEKAISLALLSAFSLVLGAAFIKFSRK